MLLSAVSVLVVAQSSSEIPEGLMNNPVLYETRQILLPSHDNSRTANFQNIAYIKYISHSTQQRTVLHYKHLSNRSY